MSPLLQYGLSTHFNTVSLCCIFWFDCEFTLKVKGYHQNWNSRHIPMNRKHPPHIQPNHFFCKLKAVYWTLVRSVGLGTTQSHLRHISIMHFSFKRSFGQQSNSKIHEFPFWHHPHLHCWHLGPVCKSSKDQSLVGRSLCELRCGYVQSRMGRLLVGLSLCLSLCLVGCRRTTELHLGSARTQGAQPEKGGFPKRDTWDQVKGGSQDSL